MSPFVLTYSVPLSLGQTGLVENCVLDARAADAILDTVEDLACTDEPNDVDVAIELDAGEVVEEI